MILNKRSPKIDKKQYLRYMKTYLWAIRQTREDLVKVVMGKHMDNYPASAISLEQAVTDMDAQSQLRQTGLSITDMYAIKEALNLIENNDTKGTSTENGSGDQGSRIPDGHLSLQENSTVLHNFIEERITRSGEDSEDQHNRCNPILG